MRVILSHTSGVPFYEQIKEQIKAEILSGKIKEGDMLPSIRQLAKDLRISVITTTRAFSDLEQEGFVKNLQGKGCYVLPQNSEMVREQLLRDIEGAFETAIRAARTAGLTDDELIAMLGVMLQGE